MVILSGGYPSVTALGEPSRTVTRTGTEGEARISGLPRGGRHFFELRDQYGTIARVGERRLPLQGTPNFRDFGGYHTAEGRSAKWGYMYRSGHLARLSQQDQDLLSNLDLHLICDFRQPMEREHHPTRIPASCRAKILHLPVSPGNAANFFEHPEKSSDPTKAMFDKMIAVNLDLVEGQTEAYGRMFSEILDIPDAKFLVHCSAGKDRTGFAAALILFALGVHKEVVLSDYLLSGQYISPRVAYRELKERIGFKLTYEEFLPVIQVHESYLGAAVAAIEEQYGSVEGYLRGALKLGRAELTELRKRYLE